MARSFREHHFPGVGTDEWTDWHWQLHNAFRSRDQLARVMTLTPDEWAAFEMAKRPFPVSVPPYYMGLIDQENPDDPLRKTVIPRPQEHLSGPGEHWDPLGEDAHSPTRRIVHTYPHKVLFLVTDFCATYCRYCTRARVVGSGKLQTDASEWNEGLAYIEANQEIRDVLISGGDPLTLSDGRLEGLLSRLSAIPHVELVRIGTKLPAVLPQRVTPALTAILRNHGPVWISAHFTHPSELTDEVAEACNRLADAGIPVISQTVLLKGINDYSETLKALFEGLLRLRVRPYYLHQCDPIVGSAQFRTPVSTGQSIISELHGRTTGFAIPMYMIDAPGGGGKVPVSASAIQGREGDDLLLRNYEGAEYRYHDPL
jgi:lysine 2,3-aminomutase